MTNLSRSEVHKHIGDATKLRKAKQLLDGRRVYGLGQLASGAWKANVLGDDGVPVTPTFREIGPGESSSRDALVSWECDCKSKHPCVHLWSLVSRLWKDDKLYDKELRQGIAKYFDRPRDSGGDMFSTSGGSTIQPSLFDEPGPGQEIQTEQATPPRSGSQRLVFLKWHLERGVGPRIFVGESGAEIDATPLQPGWEKLLERLESGGNDLALGPILPNLAQFWEQDQVQPQYLPHAETQAITCRRITSIEIVLRTSRKDAEGKQVYGIGFRVQAEKILVGFDVQGDQLYVEDRSIMVYVGSKRLLAYHFEDQIAAKYLHRMRLMHELHSSELSHLKSQIEQEERSTSRKSMLSLAPLPGDEYEHRDATPRPVLSLSGHDKAGIYVSFRYGGAEIAYQNDADHAVAQDGEIPVLFPRKRDLEQAEFGKLRGRLEGLVLYERGLYANLLGERDVPDLSLSLSRAEFLAGAGAELITEGWELRLEGRRIQIGGSLRFRVESGLDWFGLRTLWKPGEDEDPGTENPEDSAIGIDGKSVMDADRASHELAFSSSQSEDGLAQASSDGEQYWILLRARDIERIRLLQRLGMDESGFLGASPLNVSLIDRLYHEIENRNDPNVAEAQRLHGLLTSYTQSGSAVLEEAPAGLRTTLRPYQRLGYSWLFTMYEHKLGACLADDMGLGKTIQTIAMLQRLHNEGRLGPCLIVAPVVTLPNWEDELERFAPDIIVKRHAGNHRAKTPEALLGGSDGLDFGKGSAPEVLLVSYHTLRIDIDVFVQQEWNCIILDEAHYIKNASSQLFKTIRVLRAAHRISLTGTPIENSSIELWSQFAFLNPGLLGTRSTFQSEVAVAIEAKGDEASAEMLRETIAPFILRRRKEDVLEDLPPKEEQVYWCEMGHEQAKIYDEHRRLYRDQIAGIIADKGMQGSKMDIFRFLLRLRQLAIMPAAILSEERLGKVPSCKLDALRVVLDDVLREDHKLLVFSQFVTVLNTIGDSLQRHHVRYSLLTGATVDRRAAVDEFRDDPSLRVFLLSLKAGGVGINLTQADYVILFDPWWNPAVERQAVDRAHRMGQLKPVTVYRFITRGTIEEKIVQLQQKKHRIIGSLLNADDLALGSLSEGDVLNLFD